LSASGPTAASHFELKDASRLLEIKQRAQVTSKSPRIVLKYKSMQEIKAAILTLLLEEKQSELRPNNEPIGLKATR